MLLLFFRFCEYFGHFLGLWGIFGNLKWFLSISGDFGGILVILVVFCA